VAAAHLRPNADRRGQDLAAAYKQLIAVERGWRDRKTSLGLRPVYHHREDRIRAHVQLCWLALLLIGVAETRAGDTWRNLRHELDCMHLVTLATADGRVAQRSALTSRHKGTVNLSNPRATFAGSPPRFTRSRVTYEAYVVNRTSTRPQVDSASSSS